MRARIQKWGNSLALRIPKSFAAESKIEPGAYVDLSMDRGSLVVTPVPPDEYCLDQLLKSVTDQNLHGEFDLGGATGREVW
jgi:antitoxin MazE